MTEFNIQTYLHDMDKRLTSGINRVDTNVSILRRDLVPMDRRLTRTETTTKWLSRFVYSAIGGLTGWAFYSLAHALLK